MLKGRGGQNLAKLERDAKYSVTIKSNPIGHPREDYVTVCGSKADVEWWLPWLLKKYGR